MRKNLIPRKLLPLTAFAVICLIYIIASCTSTQVPVAKVTCSFTATEFAGLFKSGSVTLNGEVMPADGTTFSNTPNCDFYKWSEQMFLWLTSPTPPSYGGGGGRIFISPAFFGVSPPDANGERTFVKNVPGLPFGNLSLRVAQLGPHKFPVILEKSTKNMFEVLPPQLSPKGNPLVIDTSGKVIEISNISLGKDNRLQFFDLEKQLIRNARPVIPRNLPSERVAVKFIVDKIPILITPFGRVLETEAGQAGGGEVLMAQNGSLVYYITTVNDVYAYFLTGSKKGDPLITNATQFPTTAAEMTGVVNYASAHGKTLVDPQALAVEVKTSWIEAAGLLNPNDFIKIKAKVPVYTPDATNDHWTQTGTKTVELALVGMHVVGSTRVHPELIWATFEHENVAPNVGYSFTNTSNTTTNQPSDVGQGAWLFCGNNAPPPYNVAHMFFNSSTNQIETLLDGSNNPFHVTPSNTMRDFPWGMSLGSTGSNTEIISINNSVQSQLLAGDVRKKYIFRGATWTINGAAPSSTNQVGTNKLASATMETYQIGSNCFSCHITNKVDVSHIFDPLKPLF